MSRIIRAQDFKDDELANERKVVTYCMAISILKDVLNLLEFGGNKYGSW